MTKESTNIYPVFDRMLSREERESYLNQKGKVLWFTGLSGSGKSTIGINLEKKLFQQGHIAQMLDGDNIRAGINKNLGFSIEDRTENIRRIAEIAKLFAKSGIISICSFISPTHEIREYARQIIGEEDFLEIYINAPIEVCESRDVKGLYKKARAGEIKGFTGIDSPFEVPSSPFLEVSSHLLTLDESVNRIYNAVLSKISTASHA